MQQLTAYAKAQTTFAQAQASENAALRGLITSLRTDLTALSKKHGDDIAASTSADLAFATADTALNQAVAVVTKMQGPKGDTGANGAPGALGAPGADGADGADGKDGEDGKDGAAAAVVVPGPKPSCTCNADGTIGDGSAASKALCENVMYRKTGGASAGSQATWGFVVRNGDRIWFPSCTNPGECSGGMAIRNPDGSAGKATDVCGQTSLYAWPTSAHGDKCIDQFAYNRNWNVQTDCAATVA